MGQNTQAVSVYAKAAEFYARDGMLLKGIAVCKVILDIDPLHREIQERLAELYAKQYGGPTPEPKAKTGGEGSKLPFSPDGGPSGAQDELDEEVCLEIDLSGMEPEPVAPIELSEQDGEFVELELEGTSVPVDEEDVELLLDDDSDEEDDEDEDEVEIDEFDMEEIQIDLPHLNPDELPRIPLFSDLDRHSFVELLNRVPLRQFASGELIVREGDEGRSLFVVVSGAVRVFKKTGESLAALGPGAFFGEMALIVPKPRRASVEATQTSHVIEISRDEIDRLAQTYPHVLEVLRGFTEERLLNNLMLTSPLFTPFAPEERKQLMERFSPMDFEDGAVVIEEGTEGEGLYMILSGAAEVVRGTESGEEACIATMGEGDIFGEIALLTHSVSTAQVRVTRSLRTLCLPKGVFNELIMTHPQILMLVSELSESRLNRDREVFLERSLVSEAEGGSALL